MDENLENLLSAIEKNPFVKDSYDTLLTVCKTTSNESLLNEYRQIYLSRFLPDYNFWRLWIEDVDSLEKEKANELFKLSLRSCPDVRIALVYMDFIAEQFEGGNWNVAGVREEFDNVLTICGSDIASGSEVYRRYREFEVDQHDALVESLEEDGGATAAAFTEDIRRSKERFIRLFHRQLSLPLVGNEGALREFEEVLAEHCVESDVDLIRPDLLSKKVQAAAEMREARLTFEMHLNPTASDGSKTITAVDARLASWRAYIQFELAEKQLSRAQRLYERALMDIPQSLELWLDYAEFAFCVLKNYTLCVSVTGRATLVFRSNNSLLWKVRLLSCELAGLPADTISRELEAAVSCGGMGTADEYLDVLLVGCDAARRRLTNAAAPGNSLAEEELSQRTGEVRASFAYVESVLESYFAQWVSGFWRVYKYWAAVEQQIVLSEVASSSGAQSVHGNKSSNNKPAGSEIWEKAVRRFPGTFFLWQEYVSFVAASDGSGEYRRRLFRRMVNTTFSDASAEVVASEWQRFEQQHGSATDQGAATSKCFGTLRQAALAAHHSAPTGSVQPDSAQSSKIESVADAAGASQTDRKRRRGEDAAKDLTQNVAVRDGVDTGGDDSRKKTKTIDDTDSTNATIQSSKPPLHAVRLRNLPFTATEQQIAEFVCGRLTEDCGTGCVVRVELVLSKAGTSRGIATVVLNGARTVQKALSTLHQAEFQGRTAQIEEFTAEMQSGEEVARTAAAAKQKKLSPAEVGSDAAPHLTTVFVSRLPADLTNEQLQGHFAQCGTVLSARIAKDKKSGASKCNGLVQFADEAGRNAALLLHKSILGGGEVLVAPSRFSLVPSNPPGLAAPAVDVSSAALKVAQSSGEPSAVKPPRKPATTSTLAFKPRGLMKPRLSLPE